MAKAIAVASTYIEDGNADNSKQVAIFGSPGGGSIARGYYYCNITLDLAIGDDWQLYMCVGAGSILSNHKNGADRADWTPMMWAWPEEFHAYWNVGDPTPKHYTGGDAGSGALIQPPLIFSGCASSSDYGGGSEGKVIYQLKMQGAPAVVGEEIPSYFTVVPGTVLVADPSVAAYVWLSGVVFWGTPDTDDVWMPSKKVTLDGLVVPSKYYPWARFNGGWQSLNRDGAEQDATGLHRMQDGWQRETNSQNPTDTQHVHRFDSSAWIQSPEFK